MFVRVESNFCPPFWTHDVPYHVTHAADLKAEANKGKIDGDVTMTNEVGRKSGSGMYID
jgi:hypothetical protein